MPTPPTTPINIPLMLWRLEPNAEYHWKGSSSMGTYADIGQWRSPDIPKPTEKDLYLEWDKYLQEKPSELPILEALHKVQTVEDMKGFIETWFIGVKR